MGRPAGKKTCKCRYTLSVIDFQSDEPKWIVYQCTSYDDMKTILSEKHQMAMSRDVLQNRLLNRFNKKEQYKYLKITKQ